MILLLLRNKIRAFGLFTLLLTGSFLTFGTQACADSAPPDGYTLQSPPNTVAFTRACPEAGDKGEGPEMMRFALQPGDHWGNDPAFKSRVEIQDAEIAPVGAMAHYSYDLFIPSMQQFTSPWTIIGQWHADSKNSAEMGLESSPLAHIFVPGGVYNLRAALKAIRDNPKSTTKFNNITALSLFPAGRWVPVDVTTQFRSDGTGRIIMAIDNLSSPIVNYEGRLGSPLLKGTHFKIGIYTRDLKNHVVVCVRNLKREVLP